MSFSRRHIHLLLLFKFKLLGNNASQVVGHHLVWHIRHYTNLHICFHSSFILTTINLLTSIKANMLGDEVARKSLVFSFTYNRAASYVQTIQECVLMVGYRGTDRAKATYPKKSSTSATWSARSSTLSKGSSEGITSARDCKNS